MTTPGRVASFRIPFYYDGSLFPQADGVFRWPLDWNFSMEGATPRVQDWLL